jgi:hypothetical protein
MSCNKKHHFKQKKRTITSGPFHIPEVAQSPGPINNRLIVVIKNPTNKTLEASLEIEQCSIAADPAAAITLPTTNTTPETPLVTGFTTSPIPPHSCRIFEADISTLRGTTILRVTSTGDYVVGEDKPKCGKLEISVIGGFGRTSDAVPSLPGLNLADPALFFRYENFVVCDKDDHDDKSWKKVCCDDHDHDHKFKKRFICCDEPTHPDKQWFC